MKRLYSLGLLLIMLLTAGLSASALKVTFEWEVPGSVKIQTGGLSGPFVELAADQTSYVFETTSTFGYCYVYGADGYMVQTTTSTDGSKTFNPVLPYGKTEKYIGGSMNSSCDGKTFKVNVIKLERNDSFTIDVENGLDALTATFASGYKLDLKNGSNTYAFNPAIDDPLSIAFTGVESLYKITLNGTDVPKHQYYKQYDNINVQPDDVLAIRVYEKEPVDCSFTLKYGDGMEGCLNNIRNATLSTFIMPDEIENNTISVKEGSSLWLNFLGDDYNYSKFIFNGEDVTGSFNSSMNQLRLTITEESNTLEIQGTAKVYGNVEFTGYIINGEGVEFSLTYGGDAMTMPQGTAITSDITVAGQVFTIADTKKYVIPVSEKNAKMFMRPKAGYYISKVLCKVDGKFDIKDGGSAISKENDGTEFYMVVNKMEDPYTANTSFTGSKNFLKFKGSVQFANNWDNPEAASYATAAGEGTISFVPGYDTPLTLSHSEDITAGVYLDGLKLTGSVDENGQKNYSFTPYFPAASADPQLHSTITVYNNDTEGTSYAVTLTAADDAATVSYGPVHHVADAATLAANRFLRNTEFVVKPADKDCQISVNGELVHGIAAGGVSVNGLNDKGEYVFQLKKNTTIAIEKSTFTEISVDPADGSIVKKLDENKVTVPVTDPNFELMPYTSAEGLANISLTPKAGGEAIHGAELGAPAASADGQAMVFPITLSAIAPAGEYILDIPAGVFFDAKWDETAEGYVPAEGGALSQAYTGTVTVDPTLKSKFETYTITPASGSALKSLGTFYLAFPEFDITKEMFYADKDATITDGSTVYDCLIYPDWNATSGRNFTLTIVNEDSEDITLDAAGTWTLSIPEAAFSFDGEASPAIEATYTIAADMPEYPLSPVPGTVTGNLSKLFITFPGASEIEYNEIAITLEGDGFSASTVEVSHPENPQQYQILFGSTPLVEGDYTVTIPEGAFTVDGEPSKTVIATFHYKPSWKLTPAPGSTVESLDEFTLEFPDAKEVTFEGSMWSFILTNGGSYASAGFECTEVEGASHPTFTLTLNSDSQHPANGTLSFLIDEGTFLVDGEASPQIQCSYILDAPVSVDYTLTPDNGVIIFSEYGATWAIVFGETSFVGSAFDASKAKVTVNDKVLAYDTDYLVMAENNYLMMGFTNTDNCIDGATLHVQLEAGAFTVSGESSPAVDASWILMAPKEYSFVLTPADGTTTNDLSAIKVGFPEAKSAEVFNQYSVSLVRGYEYRQTPAITAVADAEYPVFELNVATPPTVAGEYKLEIREGAFTLDGSQASPAILATFKFDPTSGITDVEIGIANGVTVVTLDGRLILDKATADDLKKLPAGIYIINGKKVLLK